MLSKKMIGFMVFLVCLLPVQAQPFIQPEWHLPSLKYAIGHDVALFVDLDNDGTKEMIFESSHGSYPITLHKQWFVLESTQANQYAQTFTSPLVEHEIIQILVEPNGLHSKIFVIHRIENRPSLVEEYSSQNFEKVRSFSLPIPLQQGVLADVNNDGSKDLIYTSWEGLAAYSLKDQNLLWHAESLEGGKIWYGQADEDPIKEIIIATGSWSPDDLTYIVNSETRAIETQFSFIPLGVDDVDQDGVLDLITSGSDPDSTTATSLKTGKILWTIKDRVFMGMRHINNDGILDPVFADHQWGDIRAYDGQSLQNILTLRKPGYQTRFIMADDVDHDGQQELIVGNHNSSKSQYVHIYDLSGPNIEWENTLLDMESGATEIGDMDQDGRKELYVHAQIHSTDETYHEISVFDAKDHTILKRFRDFGPIGKPNGSFLKVANIDDDPQHELLVPFTANISGGVLQVYDADFNLKRQTPTLLEKEYATIAVADVDLDGDPEIVLGEGPTHLSSPDQKWSILDGKTLAIEWESTAFRSPFYDVKVGDLDEELGPEIVHCRYSGISVFDGISKSIKKEWFNPIFPRIWYANIAIGEYNGAPVIFASKSSFPRDEVAAVDVLSLDADEPIASFPIEIVEHDFIRALAIKDLNFDGHPEFLLKDHHRLRIYDPHFQHPPIWQSEILGHHPGDNLLVDDVDGDGRMEIITHSEPGAFYQFEVCPHFSLTVHPFLDLWPLQENTRDLLKRLMCQN